VYLLKYNLSKATKNSIYIDTRYDFWY